MYRICIFYLYDPSLVCCKALRSNKVEVEVEVLSDRSIQVKTIEKKLGTFLMKGH